MSSAKVSKITKFFLRKETKQIWENAPTAVALSEAHSKTHTTNPALQMWFEDVYETHQKNFNYSSGLPILELGSGGSQLKKYMPDLITSDVIQLGHVDKIVDAQNISYPDCSLSNLTMINVLHHIVSPLDFFREAQRVLTPGGKIVFTEPYVSLLSYPIYKYVHHELCDTKNNIYKLDASDALLCSNQAIPTVLTLREWHKVLVAAPEFKIEKIIFHSSLSYFLSGGVNFKPLVPFFVWKILFKLDKLICRFLGRYLGSFMTVVITKKTT